MTIEDLDYCTQLAVALKPAARPVLMSSAPAPAAEAAAGCVEKTYSVMLSISAIPRVRKFKLGPDATGQQILDAAVRYWELQKIDLEVAVTDLDEETSTLVPLEAKLDRLDLSYLRTLAICLQVIADPAPLSTSRRNSTIRRSSRRLSVHAPQPPKGAAPADAEYSFIVQQRGTTLHIGFGPTATVKDARAKVPETLGLPGPDHVTLFFAGKALSETFVLNRLRLGKQSITVYVRDTAEMLLVTARAMTD
jgi:hypothetical protein